MERTRSGLLAGDFNGQFQGKLLRLHVLRSPSMEICFTELGAKIVSLVVPDRNGRWVDVVAGHSSAADYIHSTEPTFGAVCGRYANRIAGGSILLDGKEFFLNRNSGQHTLHGGLRGFHTRMWEAVETGGRQLTFRYESPDGEEGFPGNLSVTVTYALSLENELEIVYQARTDAPTVINLTNHSYFNLSGEGIPSVADHLLQIASSGYLPVDAEGIPRKGPQSSEGTVFDFRTLSELASHMKGPASEGFDHCLVLDLPAEELPCAVCVSPVSGIRMEVFTTEPSIQVYTANGLKGDTVGKNGHRYGRHSCICLETQHYPDSPHHPSFPSTVLLPGEVFHSRTAYRFAGHANCP